MNNSDTALDQATDLITTLTAAVYLRLQLPPQKRVDSPETERVPVVVERPEV